MTTRRVTAALPEDSVLTEAQLRADGPLGRLVAARPWVADVVVASAVLLVGLVGAGAAFQSLSGAQTLGLDAVGADVQAVATTGWVLGALLGAGLLLGRRAWAVTVTGLLTALALLSLSGSGVLGVLGLCLAVALHTVAADRGQWTTWLVAAVVLAVLAAAVWRWEHTGPAELLLWSSVGPGVADAAGQPELSGNRRAVSIALLVVLLSVGVASGTAARARRQHRLALVERDRAMVRDRDQSAALAGAAERARIAREMHDVVAHSLSVMVALTDGAASAFDRAPERSREALREASRTGREAIADMQRVLGALAPVRAPADRTTDPADVDLVTLVARFRSAGVPVTASGLDADLPPDRSVRLALVRIVGEALTNVLHHAPGAESVHVALSRTPTAVEVEVVDTGGTRLGRGSGTGLGVPGMRERAGVLGGHVEAGPRPYGGWRVHAVLPLDDEDGGRG